MATLQWVYNNDSDRIELRISVSAGLATDRLLIAPRMVANGNRVTVAVNPSAGATARVEYTTAEKSIVAGGGSVTWVSWPNGDVTEPCTDSISGQITAIQCVTSGAGTVVFEVLA